MTTNFKKRIRASLADANLQVALDNNSERRVTGFRAAFASLSDYQDRRKRAHAMRADVIANLDRYQEQFLRNVQANGVIIHHAKDAEEACQLVLAIVRQKGAKLLAKSKTMVSEEIELNHFLESQGLKVVETDLGEFIVQLRGERPSHIITPAIHLRRGDVGRTFHEKLGIPYTEDIPLMTETARQTLRQVFLSADIGISGVNFGVAETGTLCVLTNEGNGRMCTTVPPVHIALMGIERMVPTLDDLALALSLLPRSSTGQKITVYGSLINSPRRADDPDGPGERHLILVDNGRRRLRGTALEEALYCIRCGACLNICPVFREIGGYAYVSKTDQHTPYPGPIGSVLSAGFFGQEEFGQLARASSLCGACKEACPVDIDLPKLLLRVRSGGMNIEARRNPGNAPWYLQMGLRGFAWIGKSPFLFHVAQKLAGIFSGLVSSRSGWIRLPAFTGWGYSRDFPRPSARPFHERFARRQTAQAAPEGKAYPAAVQPPVASPAPEAQASMPDLVALFEQELTLLSGVFHRCKVGELSSQVTAFLQQRGIDKVLSWEQPELPEGLLGELRGRGIAVLHQPDPSVKAGITGALAGVAETATLVLPGGAGKMLSASLLPEIHIAVLPADKIKLNMEQVFALAEFRQAAATALVSGPSRTADIEMSLTIGVHGPKEVHVFCLCE